MIAEEDFIKTTKIYITLLAKKQVALSEAFGTHDYFCAIGPYDNFSNPEIEKSIGISAISIANKKLENINKKSSGSNGIVIIGIHNQVINLFYHSNFLLLEAPLRPSPCVNSSGHLNLLEDKHVTITRE